MRRLLGIRIVRWPGKVAYVFGVVVLGWLLRSLFDAVDVPALVAQTIGQVVDLAAIVYGARVFRGRGEPVAPARPWWRMTAWAPASWVIGLIALYGLVSVVAVLVVPMPEFASAAEVPGGLAWDLVLIGWLAVVAALYLNSALRLPRAPRVDSLPRWKPVR